MKILNWWDNLKSTKWNYLIFLFKLVIEFFVISWIVVTITFFLINSIPGSNTLTAGLNDSQKAAIEAKYNLSGSLVHRYGVYLKNLFHGDLGISLSFRPTVPINDFIWKRFLTSFVVGIISVFVTIIIGIPIGIWVGKNPGKIVDNASTVLISILIAIPSVVLGLLLVMLGKAIHIPYIFDKESALSYILPVVALSLPSTIVYIKYIRTEMNRELHSMHARFAYLKGASKQRFVWRHALKPSLFPIATFFPSAVITSFLGALFIEKIFQIPGAGGLMLSSIQSKDYNIILFLVIIYSVITIISFALRDILYRLLDPRIRRA